MFLYHFQRGVVYLRNGKVKMEERRRYIRIPEKLQIFYEVIPSERRGEYITRDISQAGISFLVHDFIPKDSCLRVKLTFNTSFSFEALSRLVWIRERSYNEEYEVGVEFLNMPQEAKMYLIDCIKTHIVHY